jgi:ribose/xylose/arabinose/galactoside ABC-type transport system permease subunit
MLLVGALVGLINGALVAWLDMPPFMVTLVRSSPWAPSPSGSPRARTSATCPTLRALGKGEIVSVYSAQRRSRRSPAGRSTT